MEECVEQEEAAQEIADREERIEEDPIPAEHEDPYQCDEESMETQPAETGGEEEEEEEEEEVVCEGGGGRRTFAGENIAYDDHKLFVGGLSWETNETTLREYFSKYGNVADVNLKFDQETRRSRGFAFVVFEGEGCVQRVLDEGPHTIDKRKVDAKKAIPHQIHQAMKNRTKKIFVGGVPTDMSKEIIEGYFEQFGEIEEVALVTDKGSGKRRGFVFVTFYSEDSVDKCTDKTFHSLGNHQVEVKRATPREQNPAGPLPRGRGRGRGGGGGGVGGGGGGGGAGRHGRGGWLPYGQYCGYYGYAPFGGYGSQMPFGGYEGYEYGGYRGGGGGGAGYGSRYGPMKSNYNHGYHPYSR